MSNPDTHPREIYHDPAKPPHRDYFWIGESNNRIDVLGFNAFHDPATDEDDDDYGSLSVPIDEFLPGLALARQGVRTELIGSGFGNSGRLWIEEDRIYLSTSGHGFHRTVEFDRLFLDTFSVVENGELRKRTARDIQLGPVENALVELAATSPEILHSFSPRSFEVFVGSFLAKLGFGNIRLSRFVRDGGYDIYAVTCQGGSSYSVLVEVKHYSRTKVGLEIVDRLNGVRSREGIDRGMIVTTSAFSADVYKNYHCANKAIALIDFHRLVEILDGSPTQWTRSTSDLWSLPRRLRAEHFRRPRSIARRSD